MIQESTSMKLGERRRIRVLVENTAGQDCSVTSAEYALMYGSEVESHGECDIEKVDNSTTIISVLIAPQKSGTSYLLNIKYEIGDEQYLYTCLIRVCGKCTSTGNPTVPDHEGETGSINDHRMLTHRDEPEQHPIEAISGLNERLNRAMMTGDALSVSEILKILEV